MALTAASITFMNTYGVANEGLPADMALTAALFTCIVVFTALRGEVSIGASAGVSDEDTSM